MNLFCQVTSHAWLSLTKRSVCLEERIDGLQALSLHGNGEDGAKTTNELSIKECGAERSTDTLLCRIRVIDFWVK